MPPALLRMQRPATGRRETECVERAAPMVSEQELIERIRRGDLVSFKAVFERYYGGVHAFTRGVVDNGFHAEEITQNVFIRLWLKREALDPSRNFKAFLYTLARHEIADYFRSDRYDRRRLRLDLLHDAEHVQEQFAAAYDADPSIVNKDPYGEGWLVKVRVSDPAEYDTLLTAEQYTELIG